MPVFVTRRGHRDSALAEPVAHATKRQLISLQIFRKNQDDPARRLAGPFQFDSVSPNNVVDGTSMIDIQPLTSRHFQLARIESHLMQNGRMDVSDIVAILGGKYA